MELLILSPGLILIAAGLLLALVPGWARSLVVLIAPLATLADIWGIPQDFTTTTGFFNLVMHPVTMHPYTLIFATVFALAALSGGLFALRQASTLEIGSAFVYAGSAICVTFAGDLITLFIFWELMAIASTLVVWSTGSSSAARAGMRYAWMHFIGGVILMVGIVLHIQITGDTSVSRLTLSALTGEELYAAWFMLAGVLLNAAAPPFSAWLADTYPEASPSGAVFLSAFTTKTAVFVLLTLFAGNAILIPIGLFMVFYGIIYAMLENDMRRILAYSIVNQVGFMITGIGIGTELALHGAAAHAFCHIIYKALLLMSAGSVLHMTGCRKCTELGGLYHSMKLTAVCGIIGALAISAFPLTSGFVSKSMINSAAGQEGMAWVWYLLTAASAGVFLHAGVKYPWFVFFQKDSGLRPADPPANMRLAMVFLAAMCILPGLFPGLLYQMLPAIPDYSPNTAAHFVTQLELLLFSGLAFFLLLPLMKRTNTISLDFDWFYRVLITALLQKLEMIGYFLRRQIVNALLLIKTNTLQMLSATHGAKGYFSRNALIGETVMRIGILLGAYLILYYSI